MNKGIILKLIAVFIGFSSLGCMSDERLEKSLTGEWEEVEPLPGRTVLIFNSQNKMTLLGEGGYSEIYTYRIEESEIFLSQEGSEGETALFFDKLDPSRFRIGTLYPSISESNPDAFMTFETF